MQRLTLIILLGLLATSFILATSHSDSLAPYMYDAGVSARSGGDPLVGWCDIKKTGELGYPIFENMFYYSTDGQVTWNGVPATNTGGDRYTATTPSVAGNANWRFYMASDSTWAGQTPVYSGSSTCRLAPNWYVGADDNVGLDSSAYGGGDWLDIRSYGFCISNGKFYGKLVKANDDWRLTDGSEVTVLGAGIGLYDDNYGYMITINNPGEPSGSTFYALTQCIAADPPDIGGSTAELAPGILKVIGESDIIPVADCEFEFVAETMFVSCNISDLTGDTDFGPWPNDIRFLNVSASIMHLHVWREGIWDVNTHNYFPDNAKAGHAYYKNPIAEWVSSTTAPNTSPILTDAYANYDDPGDETEVGVTYSDADENPPEYVRLTITGSRDVYTLSKAEVAGPFGWIDGVLYSGTIPGYHGFGADFTFSGSDGVDEFNLPAGALSVKGDLPRDNQLVTISPNPFNSACKITFLGDKPLSVEIYNLSGRIIDRMTIDGAYNGNFVVWQPQQSNNSGVYLARLQFQDREIVRKVFYIK